MIEEFNHHYSQIEKLPDWTLLFILLTINWNFITLEGELLTMTSRVYNKTQIMYKQSIAITQKKHVQPNTEYRNILYKIRKKKWKKRTGIVNRFNNVQTYCYWILFFYFSTILCSVSLTLPQSPITSNSRNSGN